MKRRTDFGLVGFAVLFLAIALMGYAVGALDVTAVAGVAAIGSLGMAVFG